MTPDQCTKGTRVRIANVTFQSHEKMIGHVGTVRRYIKSRGIAEIDVEGDATPYKTFGSKPENLEPAP